MIGSNFNDWLTADNQGGKFGGVLAEAAGERVLAGQAPALRI
jgi:hypothetical protein